MVEAPGFHQKYELVNKLAKSPRGWGFFFCLAEKNKWKKAPPPWGFSRDTPVPNRLIFVKNLENDQYCEFKVVEFLNKAVEVTDWRSHRLFSPKGEY